MRSVVTVALLDSGIRRDQRALLGDVVDAWKGDFATFDDLTGHGTACAVLIRRMAPAARILNVKIFDETGVTSPKLLLDGLSWCLEQGVDVVNVSVSLPETGFYHDFVDLCRRAREKNVVMVAAADNVGRPSLPAYLSTVWGVGAASLDDGCCFYVPEKPIQFYARGDADESSRTYLPRGPNRGSSFATARISGMAARFAAETGASIRRQAVEHQLARTAVSFDASRIVTPSADVDLDAAAAPACFRGRLSAGVDAFGRAVLFGSALDATLFADHRHHLRVTLKRVLTAPTSLPLLSESPAPRVTEDDVLSALEDAETLILGHVNSRALDLASLVRQVRSRGRNLFSLRPRAALPAELLHACDTTGGAGWINWPEVDEHALSAVLATLPKMHIAKSQIPVVAVVHMGTQRIGRLATELTIRDALVQAGSSIAQIGSAPFSELFGCEYSHWAGCVSPALPAGQHVALGKLMIETLNHSASPASLILAGCDQPPCPSSLVTSDFLSPYSVPTLSFLFGIQPRAAVVVVDELTDSSFLRRNVDALQALLGCDVLCVLHDSPLRAYAMALGKTLPDAHKSGPCQCQTLRRLLRAPVLCRDAPDTQARLASVITSYFRPMGEGDMSTARMPESDPVRAEKPTPEVRPGVGVPDANALEAARQIAERLAGGAMPGPDALQAARQLAARARAEAAASGGAAGAATIGAAAPPPALPAASTVDPLQAARQLAQLVRPGAANEKFSWQRLRFFLPYLQRRSATVAATVLLALVASAITIPAALIQKHIIDVDLPRGDTRSVVVWAAGLLGLYLAGLIAKLLVNYVSSALNSALMLDLKRAIFERVLTLPMSFFTKNQSSYLAARLNEIDRVGTMFSMTFISLAIGCLTFLFSAALLVALDWRLFVIAAVFMPLQYVVLKRFTGGIQRLSSTILEKNADLSRGMQEIFAGMSTVKAFAAERREASKLDAPLSALVNSSFLQSLALRSSGDLIGFIGQLTYLGVLVGSMLLIIGDNLTLGTYVAALVLVERMLSPLQAVATAGLVAQPVVAAINRVAEYFETIGEDEAPHRVYGPARLAGKIEFRDVTFSYPGKNRLLNQVSFTIRPGERVAIVGANGSGKTTLMKLLLQLHLPETGTVFVDDRDLSTYRLDNLRRRIGFVSQDVFLFNDTILANLTYGGAAEDSAELRELVERCCPFLKDLPDGLRTRVGEGGLALSGGQRQAISIVRTLLKDPDVLVFDEGSAHLDDTTRTTLKTIIRERCTGKTCILISHDTDIIAMADRVLEMQNGTVIEQERVLA